MLSFSESTAYGSRLRISEEKNDERRTGSDPARTGSFRLRPNRPDSLFRQGRGTARIKHGHFGQGHRRPRNPAGGVPLAASPSAPRERQGAFANLFDHP